VKSQHLKLAFLCFLACLACLVLFLHVNCKPISSVPANLVLHSPIIWISHNGGMPCMYGQVTNVGSSIAYNGRLYICANEGEREYIVLLGDVIPGQIIPVEKDLEGYVFADDLSCTYRLDWDCEKFLAYVTQTCITQTCVSMDSLRVSGGD